MIYIAHRGHTHGVKKDFENSPEYIQAALDAGFDCEIDVWYMNNSWRLGHDGPDYSIPMDFLYKKGLWIHCKNFAAFRRLAHLTQLNVFWHQEDDYVLTSQNYIWCYPGKMVDTDFKTICVKPEIHDTDYERFCGVCSDYVGYYRDQASTI